MNRAIAWFAENHVAANLLMALLVATGLLTIPSLRQEMIPEISLDIVQVDVAYPGASPAEVEEAICIRVEEELQGLPGIKRMRSTASEGMGSVTIELLAGEDVGRRLADVRARVDAIDGFPEEAERPSVRQAEFGRQVLSIAIAGRTDEYTLKRVAEKVRDELTALPEITEVSLASVRPYEIQIELSEDALHRYGLSFDEVAAAVRRASLDLPGGSVRAEGGEILLRAKGQAYEGSSFEQIPVVTRADGTRLRLGDVATVIDGFAETDQRSLFDGETAVIVNVNQVGDQKALEVAGAAVAYVERTAETLPEGLTITVWQNGANYLSDRIGSMMSNARGGFLLVVVILAVFLRLRLALWVSLGIPIAFLGAVATLPAMDGSINWISLLGFIVVLGIVVDDAIVVGENTYTEQRCRSDKLQGAIRGAQGISVPVFFGVATTIAAFAPLLFIPGSMGRLTQILPLVVIACLIFSVIEALFILPAHLGHGRRSLDAEPKRRVSILWRRLQDRVATGLDHLIAHRYSPALERALEWRYLTLATAVAVLLFTIGLLAGGWLRFTFQEPVEGDVIVADLTLAPGTPATVTAEAVAHLQRVAEQVRVEADAERAPGAPSIFQHVLSTVGEQPFLVQQSQMPGGGKGSIGGAHLGEVQVEMVDPDHRDFGTEEMQQRWRAAVGELPGVVELSFHNSMISAGKAIELELRGNELSSLRAAAGSLKQSLAAYPGVFDITDSFRGGKQELQFSILPRAEAAGLTLSDVARQVRQAFYGEEVQRIQRGRDDVKVMLRYPAERRRSLSDVDSMFIRAPDGTELPFREVAAVELGEGFSAIKRVDRQRVVTVTADVDLAVANANEIVADLQARELPLIQRAFPTVHYSFEGEQAEQRGFVDAMIRGQLIAMLVIYGLLAVPLRSYLQPLIIMSSIPFGLVGAAFGHLLLGYDFSMYSVIGFVALSGVVVNASLVLVDAVNRLRDRGMRLDEAVRDAGRSRFRAILLTSITTFAGLTPMMLETSMSARFMIPMAISLAFGVVFASLITLFIVPCAYLVLEDLTLAASGARRRRASDQPALLDPTPPGRT